MQNINPRVIGRLNRELRDLTNSPPEGVRFLPGDMDTLTEVHVELDGPEETPYFGGTFRMKLVLGQDYPQAPPRGFFLTKIFHPNVSNNGDICVNTLKKDWSQTVTLSHILAVIRCLLIVPFPESSLNDEAGKLFMESYDDYAERARLMTQVHAMRRISGQSATCAASDEGTAGVESGTGAAEEVHALNATKVNEMGPKKADMVKKPSAQAKAAKKQKENKKKGLKRL